MQFSLGATWNWLRRHPKVAVGLGIVLFFAILAIVGPIIYSNPNKIDPGAMNQAPSARHWFGTTDSGQDVFAQTIAGARTSFLLSMSVALLANIVAVAVGLTAGYFGGIVDDILSTIINIFLVMPALPMAIVMAGYFPQKGTISLVIVLLIAGWAWGARVLRAQTLSMRERDFVQAARCAGDSAFRIIFFEILPNEIAILAASFVGTAVYAILADVGLEFLGLGDVTGTGWGTMLYWAQSSNLLFAGYWWWFAAPGICVALLGAGLSLINFGIDEVANPKLRREPRLRSKKTGTSLKPVESQRVKEVIA
jgi:peptide/nickel transport system permease protein